MPSQRPGTTADQALMQLTEKDGLVSLTDVPSTIQDAAAHAKMLMRSELIPKDFRGRFADCYTAIQFGAQFGLRPNVALQRIAVINGRPSIWGDAMLGICEQTGELREFLEEDVPGEGDAAGAACFVHRVKREGTERKRRVVFTVGDARDAGLLNKSGPWQTARKRMLQLRARAFCLRDTFADVLTGLYSAEELRDGTPPDIVIEAAPVNEPQRRQPSPASDEPTAEPPADSAGAPAPAQPAGAASAAEPEPPVDSAGAPAGEAEAVTEGVGATVAQERPAGAPAEAAAADPPPAAAATERPPDEDWRTREQDMLGDALKPTEPDAGHQTLLPPETTAPAKAQTAQPLVSRAQRGKLIKAATESGKAIADVLQEHLGVDHPSKVRAADFARAMELLS